MQLNKFVLLESMKGLYKRISCNEYTHRYSSAIFEITFDYYTNRTIDPLTFGWVIAYKNYENVRNCFLCKYYKTNYYTSERICCLYKKKGIERHCKSSEALRCNEFSIDKNIINENCDYLSYISYLVYDMSGLFRLRALSFIKIPSSHVGNFRKAVVFIVESGI